LRILPDGQDFAISDGNRLSHRGAIIHRDNFSVEENVICVVNQLRGRALGKRPAGPQQKSYDE
jgi:hypothetical protein